MLISATARFAEQTYHVVGEKLAIEHQKRLALAFLLMKKLLELTQ